MNAPHICSTCRFCLNQDTPHPDIIVCDAPPGGGAWERRFIEGESCPFWQELKMADRKHIPPAQ